MSLCIETDQLDSQLVPAAGLLHSTAGLLMSALAIFVQGSNQSV